MADPRWRPRDQGIAASGGLSPTRCSYPEAEVAQALARSRRGVDGSRLAARMAHRRLIPPGQGHCATAIATGIRIGRMRVALELEQDIGGPVRRAEVAADHAVVL